MSRTSELGTGSKKHRLLLEMIPEKVCSVIIINVGKYKNLATNREFGIGFLKSLEKFPAFLFSQMNIFLIFSIGSEIKSIFSIESRVIKLETLPCCRHLLVDSSTLNFF